MATIPFLYDIADSTGWFTYNDLANMIAVGEFTPGPIGVNMAAYVGYVIGMNISGLPTAVLGAVVATMGLGTPSVIVILIIASFLQAFRNSRYMESAFYGLRPASAGLIAVAGLSVVIANLFFTDQGFGLSFFNWKGWVLAAALWVLTNKIKQTKGLHPILFILASAVAGVVFGM